MSKPDDGHVYADFAHEGSVAANEPTWDLAADALVSGVASSWPSAWFGMGEPTGSPPAVGPRGSAGLYGQLRYGAILEELPTEALIYLDRYMVIGIKDADHRQWGAYDVHVVSVGPPVGRPLTMIPGETITGKWPLYQIIEEAP